MKIGTEVLLTGPEMWLAGMTGLGRYIEALVNNRTPVNGQDSYQSAADHIIGAMAEAAVAKYLNVYWLGEWMNHKHIDVGEYEVRHTRYNNGRLLIQKGDNPDRVYILITGEPPHFIIRGKMRAADAQVDRFYDTSLPRPCYAVSQADLMEFN